MFSKKEPPNKVDAFVGPETEIKGDINTKGLLRIDGKWSGGIVLADGVVIGEGGIANGNITAKEIIVGGKVKGNLTATVNLELHTQGNVQGDIKSSKLSIAEGAVFQGNCTMVQEQASTTLTGATADSSANKQQQNRNNNNKSKTYDTQLSEA
ncbi:MAG: polymer-forming cytoskeletal protein [Elusimicrobiota bacterium]